MGYQTHLRGDIIIRPKDFAVLMNIDNLSWRWDEKSVDEYLGQQWSYDPTQDCFSIQAHRPMHNHPRFMGLLAWFQADGAVNTLEQDGAVQDAWFDTGRYFIRNRRWGYVGRGTMVVGPESVLNGPDDPQESDVHTWEKAAPPIQRIEDQGNRIVVHCFGRTTFSASTEHLHDLDRLTKEERAQPSIHADRLRWRHGREDIMIMSEDLWSHRID